MRKHTDGKSYPDSMFLNAEAVYKEQAIHFKALSKFYEHELKHMKYMAAMESSSNNTLQHLVGQALGKIGFDRKLSFAACAESLTYKGRRMGQLSADIDAAMQKSPLYEVNPYGDEMPMPKLDMFDRIAHAKTEQELKDICSTRSPYTVEFDGIKYTYLLGEGDTLSLSDGHLVYNFERGRCHIGQHAQELTVLNSSAACTRRNLILAPGDYLQVMNGELRVIHDLIPYVSARQMELDLESTRNIGSEECKSREAFLKAFDDDIKKRYPFVPIEPVGMADQLLKLREGKLGYEDAPPIPHTSLAGISAEALRWKFNKDPLVVNGAIHLEPGDTFEFGGIKEPPLRGKSADMLIIDDPLIQATADKMPDYVGKEEPYGRYDEKLSALGPDGPECGTEEAPEDAPSPSGCKDMMDPRNWGMF